MSRRNPGPDHLSLMSGQEYVRPSMREIEAVPWNGLTAVGSFSGAGGGALGLRMAGWRVAAGIEFVPAAARTYEANFPDSYLFERDVRAVRAEDVLGELGLQRGELDLFEGSPPCASFTNAGMGQRDWGVRKAYSDVEQRTDDLFWEWVRLLDGLRPRAFVAENVPGMLSGDALTVYSHKITSALMALGYRVTARVLNAAAFGVPQHRKRLIFLGFRQDQGIEPILPTGTVSVPFTTRQALASVDPKDPDHAQFVGPSSMEGKAIGRTWEWMVAVRDARSAADRAVASVLKETCARCGGLLESHRPSVVVTRHPKKTRERAHVTGSRVVRLCGDGARAIEVKDYRMMFLPDLDRPCQTVTASGIRRSGASVVHPSECRKFTPAEVKALCGFPADFVLTGDMEQRYERCGRAVMPPVYAAVGERVATDLLASTRRSGFVDDEDVG